MQPDCTTHKRASLKGVSKMVTHSYLRLTDMNPRSINILGQYTSCSSVGVTCHGAARALRVVAAGASVYDG